MADPSRVSRRSTAVSLCSICRCSRRVAPMRHFVSPGRARSMVHSLGCIMQSLTHAGRTSRIGVALQCSAVTDNLARSLPIFAWKIERARQRWTSLRRLLFTATDTVAISRNLRLRARRCHCDEILFYGRLLSSRARARRRVSRERQSGNDCV